MTILPRLLLTVLLVASGALAQTANLPSRVTQLDIASGPRSNSGAAEAVVFSQVVDLGDVSWLRLRFGSSTTLPGNSFLRITSLMDNETQTLDRRGLVEWQNATAFFNGPAVQVELVAAPGTVGNSVSIADAVSDDPGQPPSPPLTPMTSIDARQPAAPLPSPIPRRVCSAPDTRVMSSNDATARLLSNVVDNQFAICTGWITDRPADLDAQNRCMLTAGHCFGTPRPSVVAQFNVPNSNGSNCTINQPPVRFQFPIRGVVDLEDAEGASNVAGRDWAAFVCARNTNNKTVFQQQQAQFSLAAPVVGPASKFGDGSVGNPAAGDPAIDVFCKCHNGDARAPLNLTQTTATGSITAVGGNSVQHDIDDCGGDSGEVIFNGSGLAVAIGTHGGCAGPTPTNSGTDVTKPRLQAAINNCLIRCTSDAQCDDDNPCTDDTCTSVGGVFVCRNTPNDANTCDDGHPCTTNDRCIAGTCRGNPCHFQCYEIKRSPFVGPRVDLVDQFGSVSGALVQRPVTLCAPADKNDENPAAPLEPDHLAGYQMRFPFTIVTNQRVVNQFGTVVLDIVKPERLMVPTAKSLTPPNPPQPPQPGVDHFQCYKVRRARGAPRFVPISGVAAEDQFGAITLTLQRPIRLCAPVDKNHEDVGAERHEDHLLCYKARIASPFQGATVFLNNQFGPLSPLLIRRQEFCVPSLKNPPPTTTTTSSTVSSTSSSSSTTTTTSTSSSTSSTTTSTLQTLCCDFTGTSLGGAFVACLDAVAPDVDTKCGLLGGMLSPGVCDPVTERCVPPQPLPPNDWCCDCPVPAPPFPHPQFCFEGMFPEEQTKCQPPCILSLGVACGAHSEQCGGSPSGAFLELRSGGPSPDH